MFRPSRSHAKSLLHGASRPLSREISTRLTFPWRTFRLNNTTTAAAAAATASNAQITPRSKWIRRLIYTAVFGSLGFYVGHTYTNKFLYPAAPGSPEDSKQMEEIRKLVDYLPIVRKLRADPRYVEWEAYEDLPKEGKDRRFTSGILKGSRALAVQRIFWNEEDKECINVIHFGQSIDGWPTIVHGGLLATVLDESLGRVAIRTVSAQTGVTAHLDINYRKSVSSGEFYTIHTRVDPARSTDRKAYVTGEIRSMMGQLCCESEALFIVPKKLTLGQIPGHF